MALMGDVIAPISLSLPVSHTHKHLINLSIKMMEVLDCSAVQTAFFCCIKHQMCWQTLTILAAHNYSCMLGVCVLVLVLS